MAESTKITSGYKKASETKKHIQTGKKYKTPEFTPKSIESEPKGSLTKAKPDEPEQDSYAKVNQKNNSTENTFKCSEYDVELEVKGKSMASIYYTNVIYAIRKYLEGRGEVVKKITVEMGPKKDSQMTNEDIDKLTELILVEVKRRIEKKKNAKNGTKTRTKEKV